MDTDARIQRRRSRRTAAILRWGVMLTFVLALAVGGVVKFTPTGIWPIAAGVWVAKDSVGRFTIGVASPEPPEFLRSDERRAWWWNMQGYRQYPPSFSVDDTLVFIIGFWSGLIATWLWIRRFIHHFRPDPGFCAACDYDRAGLAPSAPCPECGTAPTADIAKS